MRSKRRFGKAEFDIVAGRLTVDGKTVELDRNGLAILKTLVVAGGQPVAKADLVAVGWPDRTAHVNSLAKAIGRLRHALGEDAVRLETVHGHGYQLTTEADEPSLETDPIRKPWRWHRRTLVVGLVTAGIALVAVLAVLLSGEPPEAPLKIGEASGVIGRVLWVDDHPENNAKERGFLERHRIAVYDVTSSDDAMRLLSMYKYDAVISDMGRNGNPLAGLELVKEMRAQRYYTPFVLYTILPSNAQRDLLAEYGGQGVAVTSEGLYSFILPTVDRQSVQRAID